MVAGRCIRRGNQNIGHSDTPPGSKCVFLYFLEREKEESDKIPRHPQILFSLLIPSSGYDYSGQNI